MNSNQRKLPRLRLVGMLCHPIVVMDDGEVLRSVRMNPIQFDPEEWLDAQQLFDALLAEHQQKLDVLEDARRSQRELEQSASDLHENSVTLE